jgi:hypothetical protein
VGFTHGFSSVSESAEKTAVALQRRGPAETGAEVDFEIVGNGTFANGAFGPTSGTLVFRPGERMARLEIVLAASNSVPNDSRSLRIRLRTARGAVLASGSPDHLLRLEDDDIGLTTEVFGSKITSGIGETDPIALVTSNSIRFMDRLATRRDELVHFEWQTAGTVRSTNDLFAILWTGWLVPEVSGEYVLATTADDGTRVWIDDRLVVQNWRDNPSFLSRSVPIPLEAGRPYRLAMSFYEGFVFAHARLQWQVPGSTKVTTIPGRNLRPGLPRKLPIGFDWSWRGHPAGEFAFNYLVEPGRPLRIESTLDGNAWSPVAEGVTVEAERSNSFVWLPNAKIPAGARLRAVCVDGQVIEAPGLVPLVITTRASSATPLVRGGTNEVKLSAYANGGKDQLVRWWRDGVAMATGTSLVISGTNLAAAGSYHATVEVGDQTATSGTLEISFLTAPRLGQPGSLDLVLSQTAELRIPIEGSVPMVYQWFLDGVAIPFGTNAILSLPSVGPASAGSYTLQVTNSAGAAISSPLRVRVSEAVPKAEVSLTGDRFSVTWAVPFGTYEWQESERLGGWRTVFRTNLLSGPFNLVAPLASDTPMRFFRLVPVRQ